MKTLPRLQMDREGGEPKPISNDMVKTIEGEQSIEDIRREYGLDHTVSRASSPSEIRSVLRRSSTLYERATWEKMHAQRNNLQHDVKVWTGVLNYLEVYRRSVKDIIIMIGIENKAITSGIGVGEDE